MADNDFVFFGTTVESPPEKERFVGGAQTPVVEVYSGSTKAFYESGGVEFHLDNGTYTVSSQFISYVSQSGFDETWTCSGGTGTVTYALNLQAPVVVRGHLLYKQGVGGTDEVTSAGITVTDAAGNSTFTAWKLNTEQPDWCWVQSDELKIPAGPCTVQFVFDIADDNDFQISNLDLLADDFSTKDLIIKFYWLCVRNVTITSGGKATVTQSYTTGVDSTHSSTQTVAKELGMSLGATLDDISLGLTASIKSESSVTDTVSLKSSSTTTYEEEYVNDGKDDFDLMLWQPVFEYHVGDGVIVEQRSSTLQATKCPVTSA